jgi:hypothetical protein
VVETHGGGDGRSNDSIQFSAIRAAAAACGKGAAPAAAPGPVSHPVPFQWDSAEDFIECVRNALVAVAAGGLLYRLL